MINHDDGILNLVPEYYYVDKPHSGTKKNLSTVVIYESSSLAGLSSLVKCLWVRPLDCPRVEDLLYTLSSLANIA